MKVKKYLTLALVLGSMVGMAGAEKMKTYKITGLIGDSKCGAKNHDADCIKKCISGGAQPVFVDSHKRVWSIDNADSVQNYYGQKVRVVATVDKPNSTVHIDKVMKADGPMGEK